MCCNRDEAKSDLYEHHLIQVEKNHDSIRVDKFLLLRSSEE